jgi:hypothetical protein
MSAFEKTVRYLREVGDWRACSYLKYQLWEMEGGTHKNYKGGPLPPCPLDAQWTESRRRALVCMNVFQAKARQEEEWKALKLQQEEAEEERRLIEAEAAAAREKELAALQLEKDRIEEEMRLVKEEIARRQREQREEEEIRNSPLVACEPPCDSKQQSLKESREPHELSAKPPSLTWAECGVGQVGTKPPMKDPASVSSPGPVPPVVAPSRLRKKVKPPRRAVGASSDQRASAKPRVSIADKMNDLLDPGHRAMVRAHGVMEGRRLEQEPVGSLPSSSPNRELSTVPSTTITLTE